MSDHAKYLLKLKAEHKALWELPDFFPVIALLLLTEESLRVAAQIIGEGL